MGTWSDDFSDGDLSGWTIQSGTWDASSNNLNNESSTNGDEISHGQAHAYGTWIFDHNHGGQFYGAQTFFVSAEASGTWSSTNDGYFIRFKNSNANYGRTLEKYVDGSSTVLADLGDYDGNWHTYRIERDVSGNFTVYVDGSQKGTATDTAVSSSSYLVCRADELNHTWDNFDIDTHSQIPNAPSNFTATTASSTSIDLSWDDVENEDEYRIERRQPGQTSYTQIDTVGANTTTYTDTALQDGHEYEYRVRACNSGGCSSYSNSDTAITTLPAPSSLSSTGVGDHSVDLEWTINSSDETGFDIDYSDDGGSTWVNGPSVGAGVSTATVTGLNEGTTYTFRVRALGEDTNSGFSNTTSDTTTIPAPSNLSSTGVTTTSVSLSWADNSDDEIGFDIDYSTDGGSTWTDGPNPGANATSYEVTGLQEGTTYTFRIRALGEDANSPFSNTVSDTTTIPAPSNPSATTTGHTSIDFTWTDNATDETGFDIDYSTDGGSTWSNYSTVGANVTSETLTGLQPGTTYTIRVRTLGQDTNSGFVQDSDTTYAWVDMVASGVGDGVGSAAMSPIHSLIASGAGDGTGVGAMSARFHLEGDGVGDGAGDATATRTRSIQASGEGKGYNGSALDFDGSDDRVDCGDFGAQTTTGGIAFFAEAEVVDNYHNALTTDLAGQNDAIRFELRSNGRLFVYIGNGTNYSSAIYTSSFSADTVYHVGLSWDFSTGNVKGYFDGVEVFDGTFDYIPTDMSDVHIGVGYGLGSNRHWDGRLDDVRFYDERPSASDFAALSNREEASLSPYHHYKFDEGAGTTAIDSVGDNDGTINGATYTEGLVPSASLVRTRSIFADGEGNGVGDATLSPYVGYTGAGSGEGIGSATITYVLHRSALVEGDGGTVADLQFRETFPTELTRDLEWDYDQARKGFLSEWVYHDPTPGQGTFALYIEASFGRVDPVTPTVIVDYDETGDGNVDARSDEKAVYTDGEPVTFPNLRGKEGYYRVLLRDLRPSDYVTQVIFGPAHEWGEIQ